MRRRGDRDGMTLIWALVAVVVVLGLVVAGGSQLTSAARHAEVTFRESGQARDVARAGIIDAYSWLRRQAAQPVVAFAPRRDLAAVPPVNETDDPSIGLVREFEISPGYFGRYEVRPYQDRDGDGEADPGEGSYDATPRRALPGAGTIWYLESRGIVYRRLDPSVPWNQAPNYRVAGALTSTEVRRLTISPPATGALCCSRGDRVTVGNRGRVDGGSSGGALYPPGTGTPSGSGELVGSPAAGAVPGYDGSIPAVFGMSREDLRGLATIRLASGDPLPVPFPDYALVFVEGNLTVNSSRPLNGTGVLVVDGNLTIAANSNSYFTGLIHVAGQYVQNAPSLIRGVVIAEGQARVQGTGDLSELAYDPDALDRLMAHMGQYRLSRALRRIDSGLVGVAR